MNYILLRKGLFYNQVLYCDTKSYEADKILVQDNVTGIQFGKELRSPNYKEYCIVEAKVPRRKFKLFIHAMNRFEKIMGLYDYKYIELCEKLKTAFAKYKKEDTI